VPSLTKENLNRTQKNKVIALKKKDIFKDVTKGGPCVSPFMKQKLNRTQTHEVFAA
jgi:phage gp16-like protein